MPDSGSLRNGEEEVTLDHQPEMKKAASGCVLVVDEIVELGAAPSDPAEIPPGVPLNVCAESRLMLTRIDPATIAWYSKRRFVGPASKRPQVAKKVVVARKRPAASVISKRPRVVKPVTLSGTRFADSEDERPCSSGTLSRSAGFLPKANRGGQKVGGSPSPLECQAAAALAASERHKTLPRVEPLKRTVVATPKVVSVYRPCGACCGTGKVRVLNPGRSRLGFSEVAAVNVSPAPEPREAAICVLAHHLCRYCEVHICHRVRRSNHELRHIQPEVTCEICGKKFTLPQNMRRHLKKFHPNC